MQREEEERRQNSGRRRGGGMGKGGERNGLNPRGKWSFHQFRWEGERERDVEEDRWRERDERESGHVCMYAGNYTPEPQTSPTYNEKESKSGVD